MESSKYMESQQGQQEEKNMPKVFWAETIKWAYYVLNKSPTSVAKGKKH